MGSGDGPLQGHMLFLDGVYVERPDGSLRFQWVKAPTSAELTRLARTLGLRVGRLRERQGLLERDVQNSYLAGEAVEGGDGSAPGFRNHVPHRRWPATGPQGVHPADAGGLR